MDDSLVLEPNEARVLAVLIEKELTVPDQYPLSLNATTAGCNQKSNRNPVLALSESEVQTQLDKLVVLGLVGRVHPAGSRVERFRHNARESLRLPNPPLAILAELMMRGPQSRGDLRVRASRMAPLETQEDLAEQLAPLLERGLVKACPPAPGSRAERLVQCLCPTAHPLDQAPAAAASSLAAPAPTSGKLGELEERVTRLERQLSSLAEKLGEPLDGEAEELG